MTPDTAQKGFGDGFGARWFRVVGELEAMIEKAREIKQRILFGIGLARVSWALLLALSSPSFALAHAATDAVKSAGLGCVYELAAGWVM